MHLVDQAIMLTNYTKTCKAGTYLYTALDVSSRTLVDQELI